MGVTEPTAVPIPATDWMGVFLRPTGASETTHVPAAEQTAVDGWITALRARLVDRDAPDQVSVLGQLSVLKLLEFRLRRSTLKHTGKGKTGDVRGTVPELRANINQQTALLGKLTFKAVESDSGQEPGLTFVDEAES